MEAYFFIAFWIVLGIVGALAAVAVFGFVVTLLIAAVTAAFEEKE